MSRNPTSGDDPLRSKLQALGAGTYDPAFMAQYNNPAVMTNPQQTTPFIPPANPAADQTKLLRRKILLYSGDRNERAGSQSSDFEITLAKSLDEVVKIELRNFVLPTGIFNVSEKNQSFKITWAWTPTNSTSIPAANKPTAVASSGADACDIPIGAYSPDGLVAAVVKAIQDNINSQMVYPAGAPQQDWITGQLDASQKIQLYSIDNGLTFTWDSGSTIDPLLFGAGTSPITAINTGGVWGTTNYYYLVMPNHINLVSYDLICLQSNALGQKLIAAEGAASGFNCFTTIPIADGSRPIQTTFSNTLDSAYFDANRSAYNNLRTIDIRLTDTNGALLDFRGSDCLLEFDIVQKVKADTLGV